jgi:hypothetical protein
MTFNYSDGAVWLDDLIDPVDKLGYLLCADHSDRMTPPLGWTLTDRRTVTCSTRSRISTSTACDGSRS